MALANKKMTASQPWTQFDLIAVDTETTGKYPLEAEICEIAAVKWRDGKVIGEFQTLLKPSRPMSEEVIAIHHITNEMVVSAPLMKDKISEFAEFIAGGVVVAHHAPFDLGFIVPELERAGLQLPNLPALCSSLLSRKIFPHCSNHRLQTLVKYLGIDGGQAHRALDDAKACLGVAVRCLEKLGPQITLAEIISRQGQEILWKHYSVGDLRSHEVYSRIVEALEKKVPLQIVYQGGSKKGVARTVLPIGIVRKSADGEDFLVATDEGDKLPKRFFLNKISNAAL